MDEEERCFPDMDPAKLLPFECWLEPEDPNTEKLDKTYGNLDQPSDGDNDI